MPRIKKKTHHLLQQNNGKGKKLAQFLQTIKFVVLYRDLIALCMSHHGFCA